MACHSSLYKILRVINSEAKNKLNAYMNGLPFVAKRRMVALAQLVSLRPYGT